MRGDNVDKLTDADLERLKGLYEKAKDCDSTYAEIKAWTGAIDNAFPALLARIEADRNELQDAFETLLLTVDAAGGKVVITKHRVVTMPDSITLERTDSDGDVILRIYDAAREERT